MIFISLLFKIHKFKDSVEGKGYTYNLFLTYLSYKYENYDFFMKIFMDQDDIKTYFEKSQQIDIPRTKFDR